MPSGLKAGGIKARSRRRPTSASHRLTTATRPMSRRGSWSCAAKKDALKPGTHVVPAEGPVHQPATVVS